MTTNPRKAASSRATAPVPTDSDRADFLERGAASVGLRWSESIRSRLFAERRPVVGGFPGTMSEVRRHLDEFMRSALAKARMVELSTEEREWSARRAYAVARKDWNANHDEDEG